MCDQDQGEPGSYRGMLVDAELAGMGEAFSGYNDIIWKIRAGYGAVLYGVLAVAGATESDLIESLSDWRLVAIVLALVIAFSVTAFVLDRHYAVKKARVIVARNRLVELLDVRTENPGPNDWNNIEYCLRISGEDHIDDLVREGGCSKSDYKSILADECKKVQWMYAVVPVIVAVLLVLSVASVFG